MLEIDFAKDSKTYALYQELKDDLAEVQVQEGVELKLSFQDKVSLSFQDKSFNPLCLDFVSGATSSRLFKGGAKEAVVKAVLGKHNLKSDGPLRVFDVTAGLGRDSFILAKAGVKVTMFERNAVVYALLKDALLRAQVLDTQLPLPTLAPLGSYLAQALNYQNPEVIYYDPMFPSKKKSAQVKKEMQYFHALVGFDEDIEENLEFFLTHALKKVVLKRPKEAPLLEVSGRKISYSLDGGVCRFDCYVN